MSGLGFFDGMLVGSLVATFIIYGSLLLMGRSR